MEGHLKAKLSRCVARRLHANVFDVDLAPASVQLVLGRDGIHFNHLVASNMDMVCTVAFYHALLSLSRLFNMNPITTPLTRTAVAAGASSSFLECIHGTVDGDQGSVARRGDPSTQSVAVTDRPTVKGKV